MSTKGQATRERLLDIAEQHFLAHGFAGTSIETLITEAGLTKGGFFYHFDGKNDLALALLQRYRRNDELLFREYFERAAELTEEPLQQMLIFVKLFAEGMADMEGLHPGCLIASFTYEWKEVNDEVRGVTADIVRDWRRIFREQFEKIDRQYTPPEDTSSDDLADMLTTILEGGITLSRALNDPDILVRQLLEYRRYVQLLYTQAPPPGSAATI